MDFNEINLDMAFTLRKVLTFSQITVSTMHIYDDKWGLDSWAIFEANPTIKLIHSFRSEITKIKQKRRRILLKTNRRDHIRFDLKSSFTSKRWTFHWQKIWLQWHLRTINSLQTAESHEITRCWIKSDPWGEQGYQWGTERVF